MGRSQRSRRTGALAVTCQLLVLVFAVSARAQVLYNPCPSASKSTGGLCAPDYLAPGSDSKVKPPHSRHRAPH
jgi:hypothetical protein